MASRKHWRFDVKGPWWYLLPRHFIINKESQPRQGGLPAQFKGAGPRQMEEETRVFQFPLQSTFFLAPRLLRAALARSRLGGSGGREEFCLCGWPSCLPSEELIWPFVVICHLRKQCWWLLWVHERMPQAWSPDHGWGCVTCEQLCDRSLSQALLPSISGGQSETFHAPSPACFPEDHREFEAEPPTVPGVVLSLSGAFACPDFSTAWAGGASMGPAQQPWTVASLQLLRGSSHSRSWLDTFPI